MTSWIKRSLGTVVVSTALAIGGVASAEAAIHPGGHGGFHGGGFHGGFHGGGVHIGGFHGGGFHGRAFAGNYGYRHGGFGYYGGGYPYYGYGYGYNCNPLLLPVPPFICY